MDLRGFVRLTIGTTVRQDVAVRHRRLPIADILRAASLRRTTSTAEQANDAPGFPGSLSFCGFARTN